MKKLLLLISFSIFSPLLLIVSILMLSSLRYRAQAKFLPLSELPQQNVAYAATPQSENIFLQEVTSQDARSEMIRQFLHRYGSPLEPYAQTIVDTADKYNLDFRLIPAIGMTESNLCLKAPVNSYNCWGFGIYTGHITRFSNYPEAIETVSKTLATKYRDKHGLDTPEEIMSLYNPSSPNGSWAHTVNYFMNILQ